MDDNEEIVGFWSYLFFVILRPWFWFWIAGGVMGTVYAGTWIRDNLLSEELQKRYATQKFIPNWPLETWAIAFGLLALCSVIRNGFVAWRAERIQAETLRADIVKLKEEPLPATAPQVALDSETTGDFPITRLSLRNISQTEALFNICFQSARPSEQTFVKWMADETVLRPMNQMPIIPIVMDAKGSLASEFKGVYSLIELLKKERIAASYNIGPVAFSCEDRAQIRYLVTFTVEVSNSGRRMNVLDLDRRRIGSRPNNA